MPLKFLLCALALLMAAHSGARAQAEEEASAWRADWALQTGFVLEVDTDGYRHPTAIAFVPHPGDGPDDPLYFVTELQGTIKVVTNDRTVHVFADDFFRLKPGAPLPATEGETGLAGICLDPARGYVFATYAYEDAGSVLRNGVTRFETTPETFSLSPEGRLDILAPFETDRSALSHQVGDCQVAASALWLGVGDGGDPSKARALDSTLGKILRLNLDGAPAPDNPFFDDDGASDAADFIWAYGLRNPFGLEVLDGRVFVVDNGPNIDRFLEVGRGEDYFWSGGWSFGMRADMVFGPAISPVQMDYMGSADFFPQEMHDSFLIASSGMPKARGPGQVGDKSVVTLRYDFDAGQVAEKPELLLAYRGDERQAVVGVGLGPDALYFVPLFADASGRSAVFKTYYDPAREHPFLIGQDDPRGLMRGYGCFDCHAVGGNGNEFGPPLDRDALVESVSSRLAADPYQENGQAARGPQAAVIEDILELEGTAQVRAWVAQHIQEPGFDNGSSAMPDLGVAAAEAETIAAHLVPDRTLRQQITQAVTSRLGPIGPRKMAAVMGAFLLGAGVGIFAFRLYLSGRERISRRAA